MLNNLEFPSSHKTTLKSMSIPSIRLNDSNGDDGDMCVCLGVCSVPVERSSNFFIGFLMESLLVDLLAMVRCEDW